jgi:hypothetical protein
MVCEGRPTGSHGVEILLGDEGDNLMTFVPQALKSGSPIALGHLPGKEPI